MADGADAVSKMQEAVDQLALSMFDSLRLIPFSEDIKGDSRSSAERGVGGQIDEVKKRAIVIDEVWRRQVQSLAEVVLDNAKTLDHLIDELPGADLGEDQQMKEIVRLDQEGKQQRRKLANMVESAEKLRNEVSGTLDRLSEHMLKTPR